MEYGLTSEGFITKPLDVIIAEEVSAFKSLFGDDLDTETTSIAGSYIRNQSIKIYQLWEMLAGLYASGDVNSAWGVYLDRLANFVSVQRRQATATNVPCTIWASVGTFVPVGHLVKDTNGNLLALDNAVRTSLDNMVGMYLEFEAGSIGDSYAFTIGDTVVELELTESMTGTEVCSAIVDKMESLFGTLYVYTQDGKKLRFYSGTVKDENSFELTTSNIEILDVGMLGFYSCQQTGAIYVGANMVVDIVNNISGVDSIVNYVQGVTGENVETDDELRLALQVRQKQASGNEVAIANALQEIKNVSYVRVYSNRTNEAVGTRPAHSFEAVIMGGQEETIARTIFDMAPAGIQAFGTTEIDVTDSEGNVWTIGFSRPVSRYVWAKIEYTLNDEEEQGDDIEEGIKEALVQWGLDNCEIGIDVIYQKLFTPIYSVSGLASVVLKVASTLTTTPPADSEYVEANIMVGSTEIALFGLDRISVTEEV